MLGLVGEQPIAAASHKLQKAAVDQRLMDWNAAHAAGGLEVQIKGDGDVMNSIMRADVTSGQLANLARPHAREQRDKGNPELRRTAQHDATRCLPVPLGLAAREDRRLQYDGELVG